jgi:glutathione S-transferase
MTDTTDRLRALYRAFKAREIDTVLEQMTGDVDWPNAREGGRVRGHDAVRDYWTRQWSALDPLVDPLAITPRPDGSIAVDVAQTVRALDGSLITEGRVRHVYVLRDGLIARMDVEGHSEPTSPAPSMPRLFHMPRTRSNRVLWLLNEIAAPYELTVIAPHQRKSAEHLARHPLGRVPALELDDGSVMFESAAILLQLADLHPDAQLIPPPPASTGRARVYQWVLFAMTELEAPLFRWIRALREDTEDEASRERFSEAATVLETALGENDWLLGRGFSVADVACVGVLASAHSRALLERWPGYAGTSSEAKHVPPTVPPRQSQPRTPEHAARSCESGKPRSIRLEETSTSASRTSSRCRCSVHIADRAQRTS